MIYEKKLNSPLNITWNQLSMKKYWLDERFYYYFFTRYPILARSGVRYVYKENGNTLAQDLEPEHITFSADEKKAYISLQVQCFVIEGTTR